MYSEKKASIVERVIRTIKNILWKEFSVQGSYKWLKLLPEVVHFYNNKRHRTIGLKPAEVTNIPLFAPWSLDFVMNASTSAALAPPLRDPRRSHLPHDGSPSIACRRDAEPTTHAVALRRDAAV